MKGVIRMVFFASSVAALLACQGCVSSADTYTYSNVPAAEQSLGMTLAVPSSFGSSALAPVVSAPRSIDGAPTTFALIEGAVASNRQQSHALVGVASPTAFNRSPSPTFTRPAELASPVLTRSAALIGMSANQARERLLQPTEIEKDIAAEIAFSAPSDLTGFGFDLGVAPRVTLREDGKLLTQRFGGEVRIGQNIDVLDENENPIGWYVFAGGDGEALIWDANRGQMTPTLSNMGIRDHITVGDIQAGLSIHRAGGELALSYIRREVKYQDRNGGHEEEEDFAGVSFTLRR